MKQEIIYVGIADNPKARWAYHKMKKRFPKSARFRIHKWYDTRHEAMLAEGRRQRELLPRMCRKIEGGKPDGYRVLPWNDNMHHIRDLVRERKWTFKEVGEKYGVHPRTVSKHLKEFETKYYYLFDNR